MGLKLFIGAIIIIALSINLINAEIIIGNVSGDIDSVYSPGDRLRGWINISLVDEPISSYINYYDQKISIVDLIKNNSLTNWNCTPTDCSSDNVLGGWDYIKSFSLDRGANKTIGLKLTGTFIELNSLSFNVTTNATEGCNQQLKIDIGEDSEFDWIPVKYLENFNCSRSIGNYESTQSLREWGLSPTTQYCEKINVPAASSIKIGAEIIKSEGATSTIYMSAYDMDQNPIGSCDIEGASSSGEYYCQINNVGFLTYTDIYVCIKGSNVYKIKGENIGNVSGFYDLQNHYGFTDDYSIFVKNAKYDRIGSFIFDSSVFKNYIGDWGSRGELSEYINNYISSKYFNNCQNSCVIPIRFIAGENQQILITNLILSYSTNSGNVLDENKLYEVNKRDARLNSGFLTLNLEPANFSISDSIRNLTASIRINNADSAIIRKEIQIRAIPKIKDLSPLSVPARIPTNFVVYFESSNTNISDIIWNFGDGSLEEITNKTSIKHTYQNLGNYSINIKVTNRNGENNRTFRINVVSPKSFINSTIVNYRKDIASFENQTLALPELIKSQVEKYVNLTELKYTINLQERTFEDGFTDDTKAVQIMSELVSLKIPIKIYISNNLRPSSFFMNRDQLDLNKLTVLGAGAADETPDSYYTGINNWLKDNMDLTVESKGYSISFRDGNDEAVFTDLKFTLSPKSSLDNVYLIINGDPQKIKIVDDPGFKSNADYLGIEFSEIDQPKTVEFLYPQAIDPLNLPIVISPSFNQISKGVLINPENCNLNKKCENEMGENSSNCTDCKKSWFWIALIGLILLLIVAFILYIILQEWYKRRYESHLFKDRNQLYNLINFINNSEIQGISKEEVFKKLREMKWSNEQLIYAWNKLHGKRTGMWEIPIFRAAEKKKIQQELQKRQPISGTPPRSMGNTRAGVPPGNRKF